MPYHLIKQDGKHCVALAGEDKPIKGGCHDSEEEAAQHMAALYANVSEAKANAVLAAQAAASKIAVKKSKTAPPSLRCAFKMMDESAMMDQIGGMNKADCQTALEKMGVDSTDMTLDEMRGELKKMAKDADTADKMSKVLAAKAITAAPNLRDRVSRACVACKFFKTIPFNESPTTYGEAIGSVYPILGRGMCSQYEFETESDWVCDSFELPTPEVTGEQVINAMAEMMNKSLPERYAVKFVGKSLTRIRGYAALWGSPDKPDLSSTHDFFTKQTDFWDERLGFPRPLTYHHGLEQKTKTNPVIGAIDMLGVDDLGKWYEAELDKSHKYFEAISKLIQQGALPSSSDSVPQYVQRERQVNGTHWLKTWALFGVSLTPTPAEPRMYAVQELKSAYKTIGVNLELPEADAGASAAKPNNGDADRTPKGALKSGGISMDEKELQAIIAKQTADAVALAMKEAKAAEAEEQKQTAAAKAAFDAQVEAGVQAQLAELAKQGRPLPFASKGDGRVTVLSKYDDMGVDDLAFLAMLRIEGKTIGKSRGPNDELLRALALKSFKAIEAGKLETKALDGLEIKSNEVMQSTLASYGDEWVFSNISTQLWMKIRDTSRLIKLLPEQEIPKGYESDTIPLEGTDFTFYNVAQAATEDSTMKTIPATVTSSKAGTGQRVVTVGKLGARGYIAGELDEDSIIDSIPEARRKLEAQLPEELEFLLFNMDDTTATDNINGNGTPVSGSDYTIGKGLIRCGLKTNTANAQDMGAAMGSDDIATFYSLLGTDGVYVYTDTKKCAVFVDGKTWLTKVWLLSDLLTVANAGEYATINRGATADGGIPILGVNWYPSVGVKRAQATGVRHGTEASNTLGRAVLLRPDQWRLRWKRRAKFETTRVPEADLTQIVCTMRFGLGYYDTDAAAVAYNI